MARVSNNRMDPSAPSSSKKIWKKRAIRSFDGLLVSHLPDILRIEVKIMMILQVFYMPVLVALLLAAAFNVRSIVKQNDKIIKLLEELLKKDRGEA
ncbi:hypothetical protein ACTHO6_19945 [Brevibacillus sp. SAFN-007a]